MPEILNRLSWTEIADVFLVALLIGLAFSWLRRSRARFALVGLFFLGLLFFVARQLELQLTLWILQGLSAVLVVMLVIVFQDDLKRLFEQIAIWGLRRRTTVVSQNMVEILVQTVGQLARTRTGALIVIPGRVPLDRHLESGFAIDALLSEPLLLSLFEPHSPGHDGAVVLSGERISRFSVHLPLSADREQLTGRGTRHAAALGLSERSDALIIVVSEERGTVSVAREGVLRTIRSSGELAGEIRELFERLAPRSSRQPRQWRALAVRWPEALAALAVSVLLWMLLIPGAAQVQRIQRVPVEIENLPEGFVLESIDPPEVEVVFSGPRRRVLVADVDRFKVRLDTYLVHLGRRTFPVSPAEVEHPPGVTIDDVRPARVKLSVQRAKEGR